MPTTTQPQPAVPPQPRGFYPIFLIFLRLGCTAFGGPIAHLGYFREEFVVRRRWLAETAYAELVALGQFLPGPASSQVGAAVGLARGGLSGALAAWLGFTAPSALALILFGFGVVRFGLVVQPGWLHGLKIAAVAIVAQAIWGMGRTFCASPLRIALTVAAAATVTAITGVYGQVGAILLGAGGGYALLKPEAASVPGELGLKLNRGAALGAFVLFLLLLAASFAGGELGAQWQLFQRFYRAGALVFGGGHVVMPLLQAQVVPTGMMSNSAFLAGYGAAQAVPGPLFTLAAYLGTVSATEPNGVNGALICLVAIFLPGLLLMLAAVPVWSRLRRHASLQAAMQGIGAAVVGILLAAFYDPVWINAINRQADFVVALAAFCALAYSRTAPWLIVGACAAAGAVLG